MSLEKLKVIKLNDYGMDILIDLMRKIIISKQLISCFSSKGLNRSKPVSNNMTRTVT